MPDCAAGSTRLNPIPSWPGSVCNAFTFFLKVYYERHCVCVRCWSICWLQVWTQAQRLHLAQGSAWLSSCQPLQHSPHGTGRCFVKLPSQPPGGLWSERPPQPREAHPTCCASFCSCCRCRTNHSLCAEKNSSAALEESASISGRVHWELESSVVLRHASQDMQATCGSHAAVQHGNTSHMSSLQGDAIMCRPCASNREQLDVVYLCETRIGDHSAC